MGHEVDGTFEPLAFDEFVERFTDDPAEDPMEVKWREASGAGHVVELQGGIEVLQHVVDRPVDAVDVAQVDAGGSFLFEAQDMSSRVVPEQAILGPGRRDHRSSASETHVQGSRYRCTSNSSPLSLIRPS